MFSHTNSVNGFTSEGGMCDAHTREQGCADLAARMTATLVREFNAVNSDAECRVDNSCLAFS